LSGTNGLAYFADASTMEKKKFENGGSRFDGLTIDSDTVYTITISTELDGKTITQGPIL
jgi:hypothetical protein